MPEDDRTGEQIVRAMQGDRPWWKLSACDVADWTTGLPAASRDPSSDGMRAVGRPWDGRSDLVLGRQAIYGTTLTEFLDAVNREMATLGPAGPRLATSADVRLCEHLWGGRAGVVIDLDLGSFILPVCVEEAHFIPRSSDTLADAPATIVRAVEAALMDRLRIEARETKLRNAFERAVTSIGRGAAPLWFRMLPVDVLLPAQFHHPQSYAWSVVSLDERLDWAPHGGWPVDTIDFARSVSVDLRANHRLRARRRGDLRDRDLPGLVSDVAAALIEEIGLDPSVIVREAHRRCRADPGAGIGIPGDGWTASLAWKDGRLIATIMSDKGNYHDGEMTIWSSFPQTLADAAPGRPLTAFVDHAAFRRAGCVIASATAHEGALLLEHRVRYRAPAARKVGRMRRRTSQAA